ncbi:acyltransferase family protein [Pontivivens insulae]|uniref:Acyltransferase 3 domain-containing protein n=1 Tax=Pontivivens insulae TaxID=1639689 RepID=A0A2R8A7F2_9RHOB|nr:acyltransferase [Pontivivens insulae]RED18266.1 peptidoglycan/LPS O-acetylase OafA/YrhL [Pontivivens insulae]SPF28164.1 hypothetical protein POI8812_00462 [Pontivivens insulae]
MSDRQDAASGPIGKLGQNNFDLVRLFAATQVALLHMISHLQMDGAIAVPLAWFLSYFPGVPIFFFVSGFLISRSYLRSSNWRSYAMNRFLRLYPALAACFVVSVLLVAASGYFSETPPPLNDFAVWIAAQLTVLQVYNPDFLRGFGVGVLNGSLWTIPVEMQFYIAFPILIALLGPGRRALALAAVGFIAIYIGFGVLARNGGLVAKLVSVTFLPWFGLFLLGVLASLSWERLRPFVEGTFIWWAAAYAAAHALSATLLPSWGQLGNMMSLPYVFVLCGLVLSAAFTRRGLADRLLHKNDVSYGIYIYHMPFVNLALYWGLAGSAGGVGLVLAGTFGFAALSWFVVERPALRMKPTVLIRR